MHAELERAETCVLNAIPHDKSLRWMVKEIGEVQMLAAGNRAAAHGAYPAPCAAQLFSNDPMKFCKKCKAMTGVCVDCRQCFAEHCVCDPCQHGKTRKQECIFCERK